MERVTLTLMLTGVIGLIIIFLFPINIYIASYFMLMYFVTYTTFMKFKLPITQKTKYYIHFLLAPLFALNYSKIIQRMVNKLVIIERNYDEVMLLIKSMNRSIEEQDNERV